MNAFSNPSGADEQIEAGSSWLHRSPAGYKLLGLFLVGTGLVLADRLWIVALAAAISAAVWLSVHWPSIRAGEQPSWRSSFAGAPWLWPVLSLVVIALYIAYFSGVIEALIVLLRLLALLLLALAVMASTTITAMMAVVERVLQPMDRRGWVRADKVALMFGICLRLMPVLLEQWQEIGQAQSARGHRSNPFALLVPMLVRTLQRASEIADAIDARGGLR
jgi:biotin transport system permease protein